MLGRAPGIDHRFRAISRLSRFESLESRPAQPFSVANNGFRYRRTGIVNVLEGLPVILIHELAAGEFGDGLAQERRIGGVSPPAQAARNTTRPVPAAISILRIITYPQRSDER